MYHTYKIVKKKITDENDKKKIICDYVDGLEILVKRINDNHLREDNEPDQSPKIKCMVDDLVKSLDLFTNLGVIEYIKNDSIRYNRFKSIIGKIITRKLFVGDIEIREDVLIKLLDYIEWNCKSILEHGEDWMSDETDVGYNMLTLMDLSKKYKRNIHATDCMYPLLMAVAVNVKGSNDAGNYIIKNKLKVSKNDDCEGLVYDTNDYFHERNYDLN